MKGRRNIAAPITDGMNISMMVVVPCRTEKARALLAKLRQLIEEPDIEEQQQESHFHNPDSNLLWNLVLKAKDSTDHKRCYFHL